MALIVSIYIDLAISGYGELEFEDGKVIRLEKGDYMNIPAKQKHKVRSTSASQITIWLAIFY